MYSKPKLLNCSTPGDVVEFWQSDVALIVLLVLVLAAANIAYVHGGPYQDWKEEKYFSSPGAM